MDSSASKKAFEIKKGGKVQLTLKVCDLDHDENWNKKPTNTAR